MTPSHIVGLAYWKGAWEPYDTLLYMIQGGSGFDVPDLGDHQEVNDETADNETFPYSDPYPVSVGMCLTLH
jgi:hypothetical protein